jgi:hypothetical protein
VNERLTRIIPEAQEPEKEPPVIDDTGYVSATYKSISFGDRGSNKIKLELRRRIVVNAASAKQNHQGNAMESKYLQLRLPNGVAPIAIGSAKVADMRKSRFNVG